MRLKNLSRMDGSKNTNVDKIGKHKQNNRRNYVTQVNNHMSLVGSCMHLFFAGVGVAPGQVVTHLGEAGSSPSIDKDVRG